MSPRALPVPQSLLVPGPKGARLPLDKVWGVPGWAFWGLFPKTQLLSPACPRSAGLARRGRLRDPSLRPGDLPLEISPAITEQKGP